MLVFKILLVLVSLLIHQIHNSFVKSYCTKSLVPALYVFGDSIIDVGNNNNLKTLAKANRFPYGIDFNNCSTGRFSNGKNFADIIAIKLGLPLPPPYMSVTKAERSLIASGFNYASASCGILNSTRIGECLSLDKQIEYFNSTVRDDLPNIIHDQTKLKNYLSKSIYIFSVGSNDYLYNYLNNDMGSYNYDNPEEYANFLLENLASQIKRIYDIGARKFVFIGIGQIGCSPHYIIKKTNSEDCNEDVNTKIKPFSDKLPQKLQELKTQLSDSLFVVTVMSFNFYNELRKSPANFGLKNIYDSCIGEGGMPCENRDKYFYFDFGHPTQAIAFLYAKQCFSGTQLCFPINIHQLIAA